MSPLEDFPNIVLHIILSKEVKGLSSKNGKWITILFSDLCEKSSQVEKRTEELLSCSELPSITHPDGNDVNLEQGEGINLSLVWKILAGGTWAKFTSKTSAPHFHFIPLPPLQDCHHINLRTKLRVSRKDLKGTETLKGRWIIIRNK